MIIPVNVDEFGAVYVVPKTGGVLAGGVMVEVAEDFDFTKLHLYRLINNELVFDQQAADDEIARNEQAERQNQENQLKNLNEVLSEALLKMLYIEDADELPGLFAEIREKYSAELTERDSLKLSLFGPEEWVQPTGAHDAYALEAVVAHNGKTWESTIDDNVWEPGVYGWKEV